jgi:hypothetical protein
MAIAGWILYGQSVAYTDASTKNNLANREIQQAEKEKELYQSLKPSSRFAAGDDIPSEEPAFLNFLRARCEADHVLIDHYQTTTVVYGKDKQATPADAGTAALLKGIRKVSSTFTFIGVYGDVRKLLGELESSDRLYTLTNINWVLAKDGSSTSLSVTLSRYVAPPDVQPKATPVKVTKPGQPGTVGTPSSGPPTVIVNSTAPLKAGGITSSSPPAVQPGQVKPGNQLKSPTTTKSSPATPGVTSKP